MTKKLLRKGIILAGGNGSRLSPLTIGVSKQLLPVFDKPMIHYPLSILMLCGIKDILIIIKEKDIHSYKGLLGDGEKLGINIQYEIQKNPDGLAQSFLIAEKFIADSPVALILGDNLFHGSGFLKLLKTANSQSKKNTIFAYPVNDPERYGIIEFNKKGIPINIVEKPSLPKSRYAITGLYFFDNSVLKKAKKVTLSSRGELEITSIINMYLKEKNLNVELLGRGVAWFDTGTFDALHQAGSYIRTIEKRQGLKIGCPEEVAWRNGWISDKEFNELGLKYKNNDYLGYIKLLIREKTTNIL